MLGEAIVVEQTLWNLSIGLELGMRQLPLQSASVALDRVSLAAYVRVAEDARIGEVGRSSKLLQAT